MTEIVENSRREKKKYPLLGKNREIGVGNLKSLQHTCKSSVFSVSNQIKKPHVKIDLMCNICYCCLQRRQLLEIATHNSHHSGKQQC